MINRSGSSRRIAPTSLAIAAPCCAASTPAGSLSRLKLRFRFGIPRYRFAKVAQCSAQTSCASGSVHSDFASGGEATV